jgi:DNA end-binding protein Ku
MSSTRTATSSSSRRKSRRWRKDLGIEQLEPSAAELKLALQLIQQISQESYDPTMFEDEERKRILAAIDAKIAGEEVIAAEHPEDDAGASGQVIDLTQMLKASLERQSAGKQKARAAPAKGSRVVMPLRKPENKATRAPKAATKAATPAPRTKMRK